VKNQTELVSQSPVSAVKAAPPRTGSAQPGIRFARTTSTLVANAPKKKQPSRPWASTRAESVWNPSDHRQWYATGIVHRKASVPEARCALPSQRGPKPLPSLPTILRPERYWNAASAKAAVASQTFRLIDPVKNRLTSASPVGSWIRP
jgi:hypothetical protein